MCVWCSCVLYILVYIPDFVCISTVHDYHDYMCVRNISGKKCVRVKCQWGVLVPPWLGQELDQKKAGLASRFQAGWWRLISWAMVADDPNQASHASLLFQIWDMRVLVYKWRKSPGLQRPVWISLVCDWDSQVCSSPSHQTPRPNNQNSKRPKRVRYGKMVLQHMNHNPICFLHTISSSTISGR